MRTATLPARTHATRDALDVTHGMHLMSHEMHLMSHEMHLMHHGMHMMHHGIP